jgi:hypothetical protein
MGSINMEWKSRNKGACKDTRFAKEGSLEIYTRKNIGTKRTTPEGDARAESTFAKG